MDSKFVLVFWTKTKKTNVIPETWFTTFYRSNGKKVRLREGTVRMAVIEGKQHEAKVLRICPSKKYLDSLLVTKEGEILLHGTVPSGVALAKRSQLVTDETKEQKDRKKIMQALNESAEEQPPNVRLNGTSECNNGCANCCSKVIPVFPKFPAGFVTALVSLAEYFQHFHKSTAANILAAGTALAGMADILHSWQWPSHEKVELKKGTGVWINDTYLKNIVSNAEASKKPAHQIQQAVLKGLLVHLLGKETYLETSAENIDRRLMSGVVGFTNEKYPSLAQPIERYFKCINLNRNYLIKKKHDMPEVSEASTSRRQNGEDFSNTLGGRAKRARYSNDFNNVVLPKASGNILQDSKRLNSNVIPQIVASSNSSKNYKSLDNNEIPEIITSSNTLQDFKSVDNSVAPQMDSSCVQSFKIVENNIGPETEGSDIFQNIKSSDQFIINLDSESVQDILNGSVSNLNNKIITLRRTTPSVGSIQNSSVNANNQEVVKSNSFSSGGNILTSSTHFNVKQTAPSVKNAFRSSFTFGNGQNTIVNPIYSSDQRNVPSVYSVASTNCKNPGISVTMSMVPSSLQSGPSSCSSNLTVHSDIKYPGISMTASVVPNCLQTRSSSHGTLYSTSGAENPGLFPISSQTGTPLSSTRGNLQIPVSLAHTSPQQHGNILIPATQSLARVRTPLGYVPHPRVKQYLPAGVRGFQTKPVSRNVVNSQHLNFIPNSSTTFVHYRPFANQGHNVIQKNQPSASNQAIVTSLSQIGSFKFASSSIPPAKPTLVKTEKDFDIEGALDL